MSKDIDVASGNVLFSQTSHDNEKTILCENFKFKGSDAFNWA